MKIIGKCQGETAITNYELRIEKPHQQLEPFQPIRRNIEVEPRYWVGRKRPGEMETRDSDRKTIN